MTPNKKTKKYWKKKIFLKNKQKINKIFEQGLWIV
jgi:hypothetical protein